MADFTETLTDKHIAFIGAQPVFFTATAAEGARINLSPKGLDTFRVLSDREVAYLDLGGSGNETHAHLMADGRITIMFCGFEQPANILRIYGRGTPVLPQDEGWDALARHFELLPGTRQIFRIAIETVQTSCGWGVPLMHVDRARDTLTKAHANADGEAWVDEVQTRTSSIDGLPVRPTDRYFGPEGGKGAKSL
ncbi:pyridoxamine 5'-phosphate oxidase [Pacificimonas flava]|uniref:Pyridoxamine 5'-phosphate oxidase n=2 Tax=Pacificimonas TaxID=1960290 RepID=A0A219B3G0_9SPHN|nr:MULTISPECIES: pyridoxamine 5'-phosphate oxidase family protein [Pacificimonas]MBZ6377995.1 pyridoxamine 5'-phosphate oxidase family protein [Pacificimonas aurantium]OWV32359.1 pyridoxamine 5'-phosphate oxidase [Pacificimonas flava]